MLERNWVVSSHKKAEPTIATKTLKWQEYKDYPAYKCAQMCALRPPAGYMVMRTFNAVTGLSYEGKPWHIGKGNGPGCMAAALRVYAEDWEQGEAEGD